MTAHSCVPPASAPQRRNKADVLEEITNRLLTRFPPNRPRALRQREAFNSGVRDGQALIRAYAEEALTAIASALEADDPDWALELAKLFIVLLRPDDPDPRLSAAT